jgi:hypothetical protein
MSIYRTLSLPAVRIVAAVSAKSTHYPSVKGRTKQAQNYTDDARWKRACSAVSQNKIEHAAYDEYPNHRKYPAVLHIQNPFGPEQFNR